ncbi:MAG: alpha/beta hydrolase [Spirochaetota bacterium]|nr:alpha/beta hydrolase [Spirochaetota bacterium]
MKTLGSLLFICIFTFSQSCTILDPNEPGNLVPKTVDDDSSLPALSINGSKFHLQTFGNSANPVIIFLHGGPGMDHRSLLRLKSLRDAYFLVFYDQRGGGLSRRHDKNNVSIDHHVRDLDNIIDYFSPGVPVTLAGHSWGCMLATAYVVRHPGKVRKMVFMDPGPFTAKEMRMKEKQGWMDTTLSSELMNDLLWSHDFISPTGHIKLDYAFMVLWAKNLNDGYNMSKTDVSDIWRMGVVAYDKVLSEGKNANDEWDYNFTRGLHFLNTVLFIRGGNNSIDTPAYFSSQMSYYNSTQLITIPGVGHDLQWISHARIDSEIRTYLAKPNIY